MAAEGINGVVILVVEEVVVVTLAIFQKTNQFEHTVIRRLSRLYIVRIHVIADS
jgi:hypothetical protein